MCVRYLYYHTLSILLTLHGKINTLFFPMSDSYLCLDKTYEHLEFRIKLKMYEFLKKIIFNSFFFQFFRRGDSFFVRMIRLVFHFSKFHLFFKKKGLLGPNRCWNNIVMNFGDSSYKTAEMTDSYFSSRSKMPLPIGICKCKWICLIQK